MTCEHLPNEDQRRAGACVKCGRLTGNGEVMQRNNEFQRSAIEHAAETLGHPELASRLLREAETRTDPGPISLANDRDLVAEYLEEVIDGAGNYGPWELQRLHELGAAADESDAIRGAFVAEAIKHSLLAYRALQHAMRS